MGPISSSITRKRISGTLVLSAANLRQLEAEQSGREEWAWDAGPSSTQQQWMALMDRTGASTARDEEDQPAPVDDSGSLAPAAGRPPSTPAVRQRDTGHGQDPAGAGGGFAEFSPGFVPKIPRTELSRQLHGSPLRQPHGLEGAGAQPPGREAREGGDARGRGESGTSDELLQPLPRIPHTPMLWVRPGANRVAAPSSALTARCGRPLAAGLR